MFDINFKGNFYPNPRYERLRLISRVLCKISNYYKKSYYSKVHAVNEYDQYFSPSFQNFDSSKIFKDRVSQKFEYLIKSTKPIVVLHLDGSDSIRKVPIETFSQIFSLDCLFLLVGNNHEDLSLSAKNFIDLRGFLSAPDLVELIMISNIVVAVDSAIMHIASLLGKNTIALMGNALKETFGPINENSIVLSLNPSCSPCNNIVCKKYNGKSCVQSLNQQDVIDGIKLFCDEEFQ